MEEKCLVEKTSFDYGKSGILIDKDPNQMPKRPGIKTKKALGKPLGKIDFTSYGDIDDVLSDGLLELPPPLKNLVNVSVWKSFVLDIGLDKVAGKFSQDKLSMVRKLFSEINGFGRVFTPLKFSEIIRIMFTSELDLIKATEKTTNMKIIAKIAGKSLFPSLLVKNGFVNSGSSLEIKSTHFVILNVEKRFAILKSSLTSLMGQISKLAKKLDSLMLAVSQSSPELTSPSQNQVGDIVMGEGSSVATNDKAAVFLELFFSPDMVKFENMLESLSTSVLSLLAHLDSLILAGSMHSRPPF
ncbi:hypothetical protein G9A89_011303 [Geosiphon pyriformis]|nr:hypothetical protein G9A89_011303 [Geosiphon pyriformis]